MTLYRTYRPKTFKEVVGRDDIIRILTRQLVADTLTHAYLFSGIRGTGKTTMARLLAKAANCSNRDPASGEPCNACAPCTATNNGVSPDVVEIDAASNRRIEEVRQLREHVRYVPASSRYKVYIIDEAHMLTREAANALLKTLEEPPLHAIFILATTELEKVPDTIFSRCQHYSFGRLPLERIQERLRALARAEGVSVDAEVVKEIARRSAGSLRDAESLLGQLLSMGKPGITQEDALLFLPKVAFAETAGFLRALVRRDAPRALEQLSRLEERGGSLAFFLENVLEYGRQLMLFAVTGSERRLGLLFSPDEAAEMASLARASSPARLLQITRELIRASSDLALVPDEPSLAIELAVVLLCGEEDEGPVVASTPARLAQPNLVPDRSLIKVGDEDPGKEPAKTKPTDSLPRVAPKLAASAVSSKAAPAHSLEEILDGWGEVLTKARNKNHALNFVLGVAEPVGVSGGTLELAFKYRLQQEKALELKNRETVETIIKEVYGTPYRIEPTFAEATRPGTRAGASRAPERDELLKAALEVFEGAEILNEQSGIV